MNNMAHRYTALLFANAAALMAAAWACVAHAQLYAREAPPNSAFIHIFNATPVGGVNAQIGDKSQPPLLPYAASTYIFLPPGNFLVQAGSHKQSFTLEANHYYTVACTADGLQLFEFHEPLTGLKATIAFFNLLSGTTLALKTADGTTAVFDAVAPNTSTQRPINPLRINLALFAGDRKVADVPPVELERGRSFSLFAGGSLAVPIVVWNRD
jgi:alginate O-acetyltransferase complex protein AlgF